MTTTTDYEPPSRRVSRESLGDWALKDVMACRALQAGITEAELIHALVQDRQRLMEQPHESISRTPPPIALAQPEPAGLTDKEIIGCMYKGAASLSGLEPTWIARNTAECVAGVRAVLARFTRPTIEPVPVSERLPEPGKKVLAHYLNALGKPRTIIAQWVPAKTREDSPEGDIGEYDEDTDRFYWPQGWYEQIESWDELDALLVDEGEITHWQPLPYSPHHALPVPQP